MSSLVLALFCSGCTYHSTYTWVSYVDGPCVRVEKKHKTINPIKYWKYKKRLKKEFAGGGDTVALDSNALFRYNKVSLNGTWIGTSDFWCRIDSNSFDNEIYPFISSFKMNGDTLEFIHDYSNHKKYYEDSLGNDVEYKEDYLPNSIFEIKTLSKFDLALMPLNFSAAYIASEIKHRDGHVFFMKEDFIPLFQTKDSIEAEKENKKLDMLLTKEMGVFSDTASGYAVVDSLLDSYYVPIPPYRGPQPQIVPIKLKRASSLFDTLEFDTIHISWMIGTHRGDYYRDLQIKKDGSFRYAKGDYEGMINYIGTVSKIKMDSINLKLYQSGFFISHEPKPGWTSHSTSVRIKVSEGGKEKQMEGQLQYYPLLVRNLLKVLMDIKCDDNCELLKGPSYFPLSYQRK